jgi:uncharacterized membrane protein
MLFYTVANPASGERFTEFYILGNGGKADNYPALFTLVQGKVTKVSYDKGLSQENGSEGKVILGIINQEQQETAYSVVLQIDGQDSSISDNGSLYPKLTAIKLQQGEKWEHEIGFAPQRTGDNQKVEFILYQEGISTPKNTLHLWINVLGQ